MTITNLNVCLIKSLYLILAVFYSLRVASASTVEEELTAVSKYMQKSLPIQLMEGIYANSMASVGRLMVIQYAIEDGYIDYMLSNRRDLQRGAINTQCTNPNMRRLIRMGAEIKYMYFSEGGRYIMEDIVNEAACVKLK